jgi:hypothetical protein
MTAKDHAKLTKHLEAHLLSLGAVRTPDRCYAFSLQTPLGELGISIGIHYPRSKIVTIFCRFGPGYGSPAPAFAMKRFPNEVGANGKWNFHFGHGCTVDSIFVCFAADLERTRDARTLAILEPITANAAKACA